MAESTLSLTFRDLRKEIGWYLGYGRDADRWSDDQREFISDVVARGCRKFYYPHVERGFESWSFMRPTITLETVQGNWEYDLPDAFGGIVGPLTFDEREGYCAIPIIAESQIRAMRQRTTAASRPQYAAVHLKTADSMGTRWKLQLWPMPNQEYNLTYQINIIPERLGANDDDYPLGGAPHAETVLAACLCVAEEYVNDDTGSKARDYETRLAASIVFDRKATTPETLGYNADMSDVPRRYRRRRPNDDIIVTYNGEQYP